MGDVVSLKQYRRQREREEKERLAAANRRKHGRNKAERASEEDETKRGEKHLDGQKIEKEDQVTE